ncbi:carbon-nitrogen hydrolase family protein [Sphingomonas sp.]|uniref:carbon-nitrogen hydrolase family protein n=1 Tax=Sphingomonas sp. TaxID=28214 RepID=UPI003B003C30
MTRVAVVQSCTGIDPAANADALTAALGRAADGGAAIAFTPEMTGLLDRDRARAAACIVGEDEDRVLATAREVAARHGLWVQIGSLALRAEDGARSVNRGFLIDGAGAIRARYDKLHLFDVDLPGGESWRESSSYLAGERAVVAETPAGRLGMTICYDLRFPDLYRALSDAGATILAVPAAFTVPTGEAHWHVLLRARAIEAGAWVIAAAQSGRHADGRTTYGRSLVVDPWGEVVLDMGEGEGVGFAEIDAARIDEVRARVPALRHRRPIPRVEIAA